MKLNKRTIHITGSLLLVLIIAGCKKTFLDVTTASFISKEASVTNLQGAAYYLNGLYVNILVDLFSFGSFTAYPEIAADNIKDATATASTFAAAYNWTQTAGAGAQDASASPNENKFWLNGYGIIRACNFLISKAEAYRAENPIKADDIKAQALGIRAYVTFFLVNTFAQPYAYTADASHAGIPLLTGTNWEAPFDGRQTVAQVYEGIISDLNTAIPLFDVPNVVYMNRNAAKGLLARAYLYSNNFTAAKNMARDISATVPIMAASASGYPSKLFTNLETEALFQLPPSASGVSLPSATGNYNGVFTTNFIGSSFVSPLYFIATGDISTALTQNTNDVRKTWVTSSTGTWKVTKYPLAVLPGFSVASNSYYQTLIRSSEMYLTCAESYAQLAQEDSARFYLNAIRTRAGIPALTNTVTGTVLLDSIYLERRRELSFEGMRMFDLLRVKKGVNRIDAWGTAKVLPFPSNKAIAPLPQPDIEAYHLTQNPGY